ncbi:copper amine oxidase [Chitinophaga sp. Cy-1792]|uniref:copper amine oxidase n=1 Tax=Chitinophaga sp. Cy-1792 TaxID=2608339 RepID=UPI001420B3D4|nr:copper amine oxidase [Chitinophaga sp. Cy-1792]NIG56369.1 copper amine oxidase [Chitinophaga sp. Cy-1792]
MRKPLLAGLFALSCTYASAQTLTTAMNNALTGARQGSIVLLPDFLSEKIPYINYQQVVMPGPQHVIADDPEYIRVPEGIALQERVAPGAVRLYVYNVNGVTEPAKMPRKISAVIENTGNSNMQLRMQRYSSQPPSTNYYLVGKNGLADYFASKPATKVRTIKPGERVAIDAQLEKNVVTYDQLTHGFYEFTIDQPGLISVVQTDPATSGPAAVARLKGVLPSKSKSGAGRGVFGVSNYRIIAIDTLDTKDGVKELVMADGVRDPWVLGSEGSSDAVAKLSGNYGVMYNIEMKWKSTDGKGLALVTWNARGGGQWCDAMANTMVVSEGKFKPGTIQLPADQLTTGKAPEAVLVQIFKPAANGETQTIKMTWSPPGASCLPTPLVFIPVDL